MKYLRFCALFVFIFWGFVQCNLSSHNVLKLLNKLHNSTIKPYLHQEYNNIDDHVHFSSDIFSVNFMKKFSNVVVSDQKKCIRDLWHIIKNMKSLWAMKMLDAYGKIPSGVLQGNYLWIGKYDECSNIYVSGEKNESTEFHGMYCMAQWTVSLSNKTHLALQEIPMKTGVCLPDSCQHMHIRTDIRNILEILYSLPLIKQYESAVKLTELKCKSNKSDLNFSSMMFVIILGLYLILPVTGSFITILQYFYKHVISTNSLNQLDNVASSKFHDCEVNASEDNSVCFEREECEDDQINFSPNYIHKSKKLKKSRLINVFENIRRPLLCFCIFNNAFQILKTDSAKKQFSCLHGIRFFSMTWVILGHMYVHNIDYIDNYMDLLKGIDNLPFQAVIQGTFSVDTFFIIGGFLLGYLYLKEADQRNGKISFLGLYLHRFLRITPVYLLLIGFTSLGFEYLGSGPFWEEAADVVTCKQNWWWNLLYINNFLPMNSMCLTWTWYLANDMQFFIISSLVLYVLWQWKYIGLGVLCSLLVGSWIVTWYLSYIYDIPPLFMGITEVKNYTEYKEKLILAWDILYSKPYCRIGPHIIGVLLAYFMYYNTERKFTLNMRIQALGWSIATFCSTSVIYGLYHVKCNSVFLHFYNALGRSAFSIGVVWLIFCCLNGYADIINKFLSYKLWIPLSRLTYSAYLFHPLIMNWYFQQREVPLYFTHTTMIVLYFSFLFMSYGVAFVISIFFEAPLINLEKLIIKR